MAVTEKLFTAEELASLALPPEGGKYELVAGRVLYVSPPFHDHGSVQGRTFSSLDEFVLRNRLGVVASDSGFKLTSNPDLVRAPDVSFVSWERLRRRGAVQAYVDGPPDLAVEVKSSDDSEPEILAKVAEYQSYGTARVWVVRPLARAVSVHRPDGAIRVFGETDALGSEVAGFDIPGFHLPVAELFAYLEER